MRAGVFARLSNCLSTHRPEPLAVGLSGGGDSHALLALVCEWASQNGRKVLALGVDHRLNPDSKDWTHRAGQMARALGADWRALEWQDAALGSGLQARAREARHTLLAEATREAGASVLMLGHTADDAAENLLMREEGTQVGRLRLWSPSPVWPQGRGVSLLRPLLDVRRETLREYLASRGLDWIDDPANENARFTRVRARQKLQGTAPLIEAEPATDFEWEETSEAAYGVLRFSRQALLKAPRRILATALLCASGTRTPPRGDRLKALRQKLETSADGVAVLSGARVEMDGDTVLIMREAGEQKRAGLAPVALPVGQPIVWDGRFKLSCATPDWQIMAVGGFLNRLSVADRRFVASMPASARASLPLLHNPKSDQYVLAWQVADVRPLASLRFRWNCLCLADETTQEADLFHLWHGETVPTALFSE